MGMMRGDCRTEPPGRGRVVRLWIGWVGLLDGVDGTEVDGCADYCEGLCGVSQLHGLFGSSLLCQSIPGEA